MPWGLRRPLSHSQAPLEQGGGAPLLVQYDVPSIRAPEGSPGLFTGEQLFGRHVRASSWHLTGPPDAKLGPVDGAVRPRRDFY